MRSEPGTVVTGFFKRLKLKGKNGARLNSYYPFRLCNFASKNPVTTVPGSDPFSY